MPGRGGGCEWRQLAAIAASADYLNCILACMGHCLGEVHDEDAQ